MTARKHIASWEHAARYSHHPAPHVRLYGPDKASEDAVGLIRCRLLCGRNDVEVDRIHAAALDDLPHDGMMLTDLACLPILLARLEAHAAPVADLSLPVESLHSSWAAPCTLNEFELRHQAQQSQVNRG